MQFYDHLMDYNYESQIVKLSEIRRRNGIHPGSKLRILVAESDVYLAEIDEKVMTKIGQSNHVNEQLIPKDFHIATTHTGYTIWEKRPSTD